MRHVEEAAVDIRRLFGERAYGSLRRAYYRLQGILRFAAGLRLSNEAHKFSLNFDKDFYYKIHPDVEASDIDALEHYHFFGRREGREFRLFDEAWYLNAYADVRASRKAAFAHYREYGEDEGRRARFVVTRYEFGGSDRTDYRRWLDEHGELLTPMRGRSDRSDEAAPLISILMAVYNPEERVLRDALESVRRQTYPHWELCVADDGSTERHVKLVLEEASRSDDRIRVIYRADNGHISAATNDALAMARGDYVAFMDHDDLLTTDALATIADELSGRDIDIIYSDEDKVTDDGILYDPYFKPDFNYELLLAQNVFNHLTVIRTSLVREVGGLRQGFEGAQDHDLALRIVEVTTPSRIRHVPRVLYHWRATKGSTALDGGAKAYATRAGQRAVQEHLDRIGAAGAVTVASTSCGHYRVTYRVADPAPKVVVVIPSRDRADLLAMCLTSLFSRTSYPNFEVCIVDNGSVEAATFELFRKQPADRVKIVRVDEPFNFSRLNNLGVRETSSDYVCLLNNDIEVSTPEWLEEMVSFGQQPGVGCVGARLLYPDGSLQHGGVVLGIGGVAGHSHKHLDGRARGYFCRAVHHQSFSAVTAACLLVKRSIYESVGGLDEELAVAFNDVDFCLRVRALGFRNVWTPYAEMIHHESASRGFELTPEKQARFRGEIEKMIERWGDELLEDPAYNPNLTLEFEDFSLAWPPRLARRPSRARLEPTPAEQAIG